MDTFDKRMPDDIREKLKSSKVAISGLGGLGSNIAVMLTRTGVGNLLLVDFDKVDTSNLNRQVYSVPHLDMYKTDALKNILKDINTDTKIKTICTTVTKENAVELFKDYPIVCEAFDKPDNKAMLINTLLTNTNATLVSGNGMAGFGDSNSIVTKKAMSRLYICGDGKTDVKDNILTAPRVALCAAHQANKIIELIIKGE